MLQQFRGRSPLRRITFQHALDEIFGRIGYLIPIRRGEIESSSPYRIKDLIVRITIERRISAEEDVGDDPDTPNVAAFGVFPVEYLGGYVVGRAYL
eukprot:scaffold305764_cov113-Cyclotella_meneghiniana.AAC.1